MSDKKFDKIVIDEEEILVRRKWKVRPFEKVEKDERKEKEKYKCRSKVKIEEETE